MKPQIIFSLRQQAKRTREIAEGQPAAVKCAMINQASEYDSIADNIELGTVQLRQVGQLSTVK